jgi:cell division protein FtsA
MSAPEGVLSKRQKELWVVCIDIWAATTWITVYEEGSLKFAKVIPVWWENVTNDIALWVRVSIDTAEKLKLDYAEINKDEEMVSKEIDLKKVSKNEEWKVETDYLAKIVTARYEEIFYFIRDELRAIWKDWMLPEGAILVWWASKMKWIIDLAKDILRLPVVIWTPSEKDSLTSISISDPVFASVVWTLILANIYNPERVGFSFNLLESFKKLFKKISPF